MLSFILAFDGSRRQVVKAPGCGSGIRGFKSRRLPHFLLVRIYKMT